MRKQIYKHTFYYSSLFIIMALCSSLVLVARGDTNQQLSYVGLAAFLYAFWGIVHHKLHHDLHFKVVVEYLLMAVLGIAIMFFLLQ